MLSHISSSSSSCSRSTAFSSSRCCSRVRDLDSFLFFWIVFTTPRAPAKLVPPLKRKRNTNPMLKLMLLQLFKLSRITKSYFNCSNKKSIEENIFVTSFLSIICQNPPQKKQLNCSKNKAQQNPVEMQLKGLCGKLLYIFTKYLLLESTSLLKGLICSNLSTSLTLS